MDTFFVGIKSTKRSESINDVFYHIFKKMMCDVQVEERYMNEPKLHPIRGDLDVI